MTRTGDITKKVGLNIKLLRVKLGMSQEMLAEKADLSKTSIGSIERATSVPSLETLDRIAKALGVTLPELVDVSKFEF